MSALRFSYSVEGLHLPALRLWLDARQAQRGEKERVFVSHAHADHTADHREIITTPATAKLMRARMGGEGTERLLEYRKSEQFEGEPPFQITLLPAGHIHGSAMALIEAEGESLLYTGDFKLRGGFSAEPCEPRQAGLLIMESTYGRPEYRFPPASDVLPGIIRFCREALENEETPLLLGYSLGKAQELLSALNGAGFELVLHSQAYKLARIYEEAGHAFPLFEKLNGAASRGKVVLCPPGACGPALVRQLAPVRKAVITGWAVDPACRFRYQADAAFPLSDHADFEELLELARIVAPKKIYTLHGFAADLAASLRERGFDAQALTQEEQLRLPLGVPEVLHRSSPARFPEIKERAAEDAGMMLAEQPRGEGEDRFAGFTEICARIGRTSKKLEKISLLSGYLRGLRSESLARVMPWFTGRPFSSAEHKVMQIGWAIVRDALCQAAKIDHEHFGRIYLKHSDLGETACEVLADDSGPVSTLGIEEVDRAFHRMHSARGPLAKRPVLSELLERATALEGKYILKILTGDLRIGLKEGLVEEAIGQAFGFPLERVKYAHLLLGDLSETARLALAGNLRSASLLPFRPVKYMLASPTEDAAEAWKRAQMWALEHTPRDMASQTALGLTIATAPPQSALIWVEDKYDGIRAQLHKVGARVALYSRDLKEITVPFLEVADAVAQWPEDFILDGELVALRHDQALPFAELQKRLGRRESDLFLHQEIPVKFVAFDLLWESGESLIDEPLSSRRGRLEKLLRPSSHLQLSRVGEARSPLEIEAAFTAAQAGGNEGLMIKNPGSVYTPGRRGLAWLKLKKARASLDCVVVGAEYGHGKRKAVLSDYTFAVRDETTGELRIIGKAYSGLTDQEIAELTAHFLKTARRQHGRHLEVRPEIVLEIAFDLIQPSDRHNSGLAMRFPRILRIRRDKSPAEIDTLSTARALVR